VIYYWYVPGERLLMLYLYRKTKQEDLSAGEVKALARLILEEYP